METLQLWCDQQQPSWDILILAVEQCGEGRWDTKYISGTEVADRMRQTLKDLSTSG